MSGLGTTRQETEALDPAVWEALARVKGESDKAHTAFLDYIRLGPDRSLRKLHARYRVQSGGKAGAETAPPTKRLNTLANWSSRYQWQKRLAAYKQERERREQARWEERRRDVREADYTAGEALRDLAAQVLRQAPLFDGKRRVVRGKDGEPDTIIETVALKGHLAVQALKLASELQRQAAEVQPPTQRLEHTGRDGGPIQTAGVVIYIPKNGREANPDGDGGDEDSA